MKKVYSQPEVEIISFETDDEIMIDSSSELNGHLLDGDMYGE